jgi:hypothetical protein
MKHYTITKRIAKHGRQAVIVIPALLQNELPPGTVVALKMEVIREAEHG